LNEPQKTSPYYGRLLRFPLKTLKERQRFSDNSWKSSKHLHQCR